jgi:hypothetical protein
MSSVLDRLRPHPHRGDVIAAGAVPLALAAIVIEQRMTQWSLGPRFAVVALISVLLLTLGWLAPLESEDPRAYHTVLLLSGLLPLILALVLLAEVLGAARPPGAGGICWTFAVEAVLAGVAARRFNSGACTLLAALAGAIAVQELVVWAFKPHGLGTFRAVLLLLFFGFAAGATRLRDHRRRHAVQLINAAGLMALVLAATFMLAPTTFIAVTTTSSGGGGGVAFGWELFLLAVGCGMIAYAGADREPGPAYIGTGVLLAFALLAGSPLENGGSLVGWPLFLLALGGVGLAIGLRPRRELPPPPLSGSPAPTVPLHPTEGEGSS